MDLKHEVIFGDGVTSALPGVGRRSPERLPGGPRHVELWIALDAVVESLYARNHVGCDHQGSPRRDGN